MLTLEIASDTRQHKNGRINKKIKYQTTCDKSFEFKKERGYHMWPQEAL